MDFAIDLGGLLHRPGARRRSGRLDQATSLPQVEAPAPDEREIEAGDRVLRELAGAALLVERGVATRVLVCNIPAAIDLDEVRLLADTFDVVVEPIVRVGGGGFDFSVRPASDARG